MVPKGFWSMMAFCVVLPFIIVATWPVWVFFGVVKDMPKPKKQIKPRPLPTPLPTLKPQVQYVPQVAAKAKVVKKDRAVKEVDHTPPKVTTREAIINDAISALVAIGFKKTEAKNAVHKACNGKVFDNVQDVIKATMKKPNWK
jgi:hypothetical protein